MFNFLKSKLYDPAQVHYVVHSDYRTVAQGWARADGTGPLDLWGARNPGYVYRTGDYSTHTLAIQAAIDSMVDFRADTLYWTPGQFLPATALTIDVPDARWLGPKCSHPTLAAARLAGGAAANVYGITADADRMEIGYLQLLATSGQTLFNVGAVSGLHVHDTFYNMDAVATSASTIGFVLATAIEFVTFDNTYIWVDATQGAWIQCTGIIKGLKIKDFQIFVEAGTWAVAIQLNGVGQADHDIGPGSISGAGTALTSLLTAADKTINTTHGYTHNVTASTVGPAATALTVAAGVAAELDIASCRRGVASDTLAAAVTTGDVAYTG